MAFAFVNTRGDFNDASGGSLATAATSLTAGNLIVVWCVYTSPTATTNTPTDLAGNTYLQHPFGFSRVSSEVIDCWYCPNALGNASNTVQFTPSVNSTFRRIITMQYSGASASPVAEAGSSGTIASNVHVDTGNIVITGANNMIAALGTNGTGTGTYSAGTSMTLRGSTIGTDTQGEDRLNIGPGTYTAGITLSAAAQQWIGAVSFSDAPLPTGGGVAVPFNPILFTLQQFRTPKAPRIFAFPVALPGLAVTLNNYELSADPGSYAVTGVASGLIADRMVNAATGAYTVTGVDASLVAGRMVNAATGSYTTTGVATGLVAGRMVNAATGSYTLSGVAASPIADRLIGADPGSYLINGVAATLLYTAGAAAFSISADPGSYTIAGIAASPIADRMVNTAAGSYTLTGVAASTVAGRVINAATGSHTLTGVAVTMSLTRVIGADPGAYTLNGVDTTLDWSGFTPPATQGNDDIAAIYSTL